MRSSLANQLVVDCKRNGLGESGFLRSRELRQGWWRGRGVSDSVQQYVNQVQDGALREWLKYGIAIHTAALCSLSRPRSRVAPGDRGIVETLFEHGYVQVVCTTSTLALGVNLPVYLVIIKGTIVWRGGGRGYEEISDAMLQQMVRGCSTADA